MNINRAKHIVWLDNLKACLIVLVVLGHCIQHTLVEYADTSAFRYIYSFHMALFMFVSGFACYREEVEWNLVTRRAKQLLIPYLVWSLVLCLIRGEFKLYDMLLNPTHSFWFLWVLFFITLLHVAACRIAKRYAVKEEWVVMAVAVLLLGLKTVTRTNLFALNLITYHYVFYILGFYARKYGLMERIRSGAVSYIALVCWVVLAWFWAGDRPIYQLAYRNSTLTMGYHYATALTAIIAFMQLSKRLLNHKYLIFGDLGVATLAIYVIHLSLLSALPKGGISSLGMESEWFFILFLTLVVTAVSYGLYRLLRLNRITAILFIGK